MMLDAIYHGDCMDMLNELENDSIQLIITSPPYNIGKDYEDKVSIDEYFESQKEVISLCIDKLQITGSICWQVGNYINRSGSRNNIIPIDILLYQIFADRGLKLRNRIVWHYGHGLHAKYRLSGRYETILWFTKSDDYVFNLDSIRVPQKYPNKKHFKGKKKGELSGNPLGKNPSDVWDIPNVKNNHPENTGHGSQFPLELARRLIKMLSNEGEIVVDPYLGVGTTAVAAKQLSRIVYGSEINKEYCEIAKSRLEQTLL